MTRSSAWSHESSTWRTQRRWRPSRPRRWKTIDHTPSSPLPPWYVNLNPPADESPIHGGRRVGGSIRGLGGGKQWTTCRPRRFHHVATARTMVVTRRPVQHAGHRHEAT